MATVADGYIIAVLDRADNLASTIEAMLAGRTVHRTALVIALNEFRMAQVGADLELGEELEDMLEKFKKDIDKK